MDIRRRAIDRVREAIRRHDSGAVRETAGRETAESERAARPNSSAREALREHDEAAHREHSP